MPRPSKRKAAPPVRSSDVDPSLRPAPKKSRTKQIDKIDHLFDTYSNKSIDLIDPAGIESLCSDLGVDHTDIRILILAWKMKAEKQGYFSKDEWQRGLKCLGVDTLPKLRKAVLGLEKEVLKSGHFEEFYIYAFQYCLTEEMQRSVDVETICELLNVVLGSQFPTQVKLLIDYLKIQNDYRALNLDHWSNFYRFFKEVSFLDLQSYDPSQAWPVILDSFVEWLKERENKTLLHQPIKLSSIFVRQKLKLERDGFLCRSCFAVFYHVLNVLVKFVHDLKYRIFKDMNGSPRRIHKTAFGTPDNRFLILLKIGYLRVVIADPSNLQSSAHY